MKKTFTLLAVLLVTAALNAQTPIVTFQKCFGGSGAEYTDQILPLEGGGYIIAGLSRSNDGDVTGHHGDLEVSDGWILKVDESGTIIWQKSIGGSNYDSFSSVAPVPGGGYIAVGYTRSNDGDVTGHHGSDQYSDFWVVKLDENGNLLWQKSLGGSDDDQAYAVKAVPAGGYIVTGWTRSYNGDVTDMHGGEDCWVVKLSNNGAIEWQKSLGGSGGEMANYIITTADGGYALTGYSFSNDGDVTTNQGSADYWVVKLNSTGNIVWQKTYGGSNYEEAGNIETTADGGYIVGGYSNSSDGDSSVDQLYDDYWIIKLDALGNLVWEKSFGGSGTDYGQFVIPATNGGYIAVGQAISSDGDVTNSNGELEAWVVKMDENGEMQWQKSFGGSAYDFANSIYPTPDGNYVLSGTTNSNNGDVSGNHGLGDIWLAKIGPESLGVDIFEASKLLAYPNPVKDILYFKEPFTNATVYSIEGKLITTATNAASLNVSNLSLGVYILEAESGNLKKTMKFVKN